MIRLGPRIIGVLALLLNGCFLFHRLDDDTGEDAGVQPDSRVESDAGTLDAGGACGNLGIYRACGEYCDPGCQDTAPFRCEPSCPDGSGCIYAAGICRSVDEYGENERRSCGTEFGFDTTFTNSSSRPDYACVTEPGHDFDPFEPSEPTRRTGSLHTSYCVEARGLFEGIECFYPDRTPVVTGPPAEACPDSLSDVFRFCGRECDGCDVSDDQLFRPSCLGINDERGIGICTDRGCRPGEDVLDPAYALDRYGEVTACLVPRHAETREYWEYGWAVGLETCKAYRALYPADLDCRDIDWGTIPE